MKDLPSTSPSSATAAKVGEVFRRDAYVLSPSNDDSRALASGGAAPSTTVAPGDVLHQHDPDTLATVGRRPKDRIDYRPVGGPLLTYLWCGGEGGGGSKTNSSNSNGSGVHKDVEDTVKDDSPAGGTTSSSGSPIVDDHAGGPGHAPRDTCCSESDPNNDENRSKENDQPPAPSSSSSSTKPSKHQRQQRSNNQKQVLSGQTLYLGGEIGIDGNMYCIPGHAPHVLKVSVADGTDDVTLIGPPLPGKFKWLRGVAMGDVIYGLPCHADSVLRIHVPTQTVTTIDIPYEAFYDDNAERATQQRHQEWKYHGGSVSPHNGCLYGIPQSALHVLKIDPVTEVVSLVGPPLPGRYKWYGGIVGHHDGAIYGIPHNATGVLRIGTNDTISVHGQYDEGGHKWHGAAAAPASIGGGAIVSVPANADTVLCIFPNAPTVDEDDNPPPTLIELGGPDVVKTGRHRTDRKYKYLGAMAGPDGNVYCFPSGSEHVLQVNAETRTVRAVGPNLYDAQMERLCQNKWQNGVCVNNNHERAVYAIPLAAESVLRIDCGLEGVGDRKNDPEITTWPLPKPYKGLAKWEGAVLAPNGVIYTVPNNHKAILRIEPPRRDANTTRPTEPMASTIAGPKRREDVPYGSGIPTLRSSAHRVKHTSHKDNGGPKPKDRDGQETGTPFLPSELCLETVLDCDTEVHTLVDAVRSMLKTCDSNMVGSFAADDDHTKAPTATPRLESFRVPTASTWRTVNGGQCESAQRYLSDQVASCDKFLEVFDRFVHGVVLPHIKGRLVGLGLASDAPGSVKFYYQRPPTVRLQPGPAWAQVKPHSDAEYGHQNGELNVWVPLSDRELTGVDLWAESSAMAGDYHPLQTRPGQIVLFHGSSCRHYVNPNASSHTRVSLDFRVGVEGYFDAEWEMRGTTDDHSRREAIL